jgi:hypothetical protein
MACKGCNRFLDVRPWKDSDITLDGLVEGYNRVQEAGLVIHKCRVSGGEPLLHPRFVDCMTIIQSMWNKDYGGRTCVFTNGKLNRPAPAGWRYNVSNSDGKSYYFHPPMISPHDLGMEPLQGMTIACRRQLGCGRLFDAFGFSFCVFAGAIGRLLGVDPYSPTPVVEGIYDICKHCVFSQGIKKAFVLFDAANNGDLEYPTKSYQSALKRKQNFEFKKFLDR